MIKKTTKAYVSFTRNERIGIATLLAILILLIIIKATMSTWVNQFPNTTQETATKAWKSYRERNTTAHQADTSVTASPNYKINLNTADATTLQSLKGIGPANAQQIINYRKNNGRLTDFEQIRAICTMPEATFKELKMHATLND